jgi:hypothetical protein
MNLVRPTRAAVCTLSGSILTTAAAWAGPVSVQVNQPTLDRWMYPFNSTPGVRTEAGIFAALGLAGFDDRDGQFLIGFDTGSIVAPGQGTQNYHVRQLRLRLRISQHELFVYDPTFDSVTTSYPVGSPGYTPDEDPGKPVEVFGAGYRNGYTVLTFCETCPFGGEPIVPPAEGARNVFPAVFDAGGAATDVSRQVRLQFEAPPMSVGKTTAAAPGAPVPIDAEFVFDLDLCDPMTRAYVGRSLDAGRLNLIATTLLPIPGPGVFTYPTFYTKENPIAQAQGYMQKLEMVVNVGFRSDFNNDGAINLADFGAFQTAYALGHPGADINGDCTLNLADFGAFQTLYALGR